MCRYLFSDKRLVSVFLGVWTMISCVVFLSIMMADGSAFLMMGPNDKTRLFNVPLNTWPKWWAVAIYTFVSTCIAAFASDSVAPFITNTIQDHKTKYIPYSKSMCLIIIQVWTVYAVIMGTIGLFVALTQVDFLLIRLVADVVINVMTTAYFLQDKQHDAHLYGQWEREQFFPTVLDDDVQDMQDMSVSGGIPSSDTRARELLPLRSPTMLPSDTV